MESNQLTAAQIEARRKKTFETNKWIFSGSGVGRDILYQLIASFLLTYIQFGVSLTLAQFTALSIIIGVGGRIWDAVNDPMMGAIIEGTHLKMGKFRPWILLGAISCGLVVILMFNIQSLAGWEFVVFMTVMYLLWESTFTMNDIGYWSMLPSLSSKKEERNSVTSLTVLFAGVGAIIAQGVVPIVTTGDVRAGYRLVGVAVGVIFIISQTITFFGVKETPRPRKENAEKISLKKMWQTIIRNDQILWMTLSQLFYNIASAMLTALAANLLYVELGYNGTLYFYAVVAYGVSSVLVNVLYPWLVKKTGRRKLQNISIYVAVVGYIVIALMGWTDILPFSVPLLCAMLVLTSSGQSLFYMASIINMTNCVEYNEYKFGERNEAVVSTLRPFMAKFASAMHTLIVTLVLAVSGTFLLSQSISTLETQRDFFARMDSVSQKTQYIAALQDYAKEFDSLEIGTDAYNAAAASVAAKIDADAVMCDYQIDSQYVPALQDAMVIEQVGEDYIEVGRLGEIEPSSLVEGGKYTLEVGDLQSGEESAANLNFRDKSTLGMRVWIRAAVSIVPIALLLLSLYIQKKKFVIDEEYYDMMMAEITKRHETEDK